MVTQTRKTLSEYEAFIELPQNTDRRFELIDGEIVEKVTTEEHGIIAINIGSALKLYAKVRGDRVSVEPRHRVEGDDTNARIPDVAYTLKQDALPVTKKGAVPKMPSIAIEIKSPSDTYTGVRGKGQYYLANGVRMVWLVFPAKRIVEIYQPDKDLQILIDGDTIDGDEVLPSFSLPIEDVFEGV